MGGVLYPSLVNKLIYTIGYGWAIRTGRFLVRVRPVLKALGGMPDMRSLAVGFINVALLAFACIVIDSRLPPRPIERLSSFVDFKVFVGTENRGYMLYVVGAAVVWLGRCPSDLHSPMTGTKNADLLFPCSEGLYTPIFYSCVPITRCSSSCDSH